MSYIYKAYKVIDEVTRKGAYSTQELNRTLKLTDEVDRAKVTKIVYGVLNNNIMLELFLSQICNKRPKPSIASLLKTGIYIIKYIDGVPNYAAVNETVKIAKKISKGNLTGFVNATLKAAMDKEVVLPLGKLERLSAKYSYPMWATEKIISEYGDEIGEGILAADNIEDENVRINLNEISVLKFTELLKLHKIEYKESPLADSLRVNFASITSCKEIYKKYYSIMSLSSMMAVNALEIKQGKKLVDVCAAPGGKAIYAAQKLKDGEVLALELHQHRVELIESYAARLKVKNITAKQFDSTTFDETLAGIYDYVMCDVPCSGFGTTESKPEIKSKKQSNILELAELQEKIITASSKYLKVGGKMVYSTCTIFEEENSKIVQKFLDKNKNFKEETVNVPNGVDFIKKEYGYQLLPNLSKTEGFYFATLLKTQNN